jgi:RNA polymerase sigma-70 factor (ECF subfamily)
LTAPKAATTTGRPQAEVIAFPKIGGSDHALAVALREGRPGASAEFVDRYGPFVQGLLLKVVGFDPDVADLLQEVFLRALESIGELKRPAALKSWLGSITVFTARAFLRRRRFRRGLVWSMPPEKLPEPSVAPASLEATELLRRTYAALSKLPVDERIAFVLRFAQELSLGEVAELCGVSLATIKRRLRRGESRFLAAARQDALLAERIERGGRWRNS